MHASTRGADGNTEYALSEDETEDAMRLWIEQMPNCDSKAICARVNEEISSDRDRPATGPAASAAARSAERMKQQQLPIPAPISRTQLAPGQIVRIGGVASRPTLNGQQAKVLHYDFDRDRYAVEIRGTKESVSIGADKLRLVESESDQSAPHVSKLVDAAQKGRLKTLEKLIKQGGSVNGITHGRGGRPLCAAAAEDHLGCVQLLLKSGAEVDSPNAYGATALHDASYHGSLASAKELLDCGAKPDSTDQNGATPLMAACAAGHVGVVKLLLDHGAKVGPNVHAALQSSDHTNRGSIAELLKGVESAPPKSQSSSRSPPKPLPEAAEAPTNSKKPGAAPFNAEAPASLVGAEVEIHGLSGRPELNGRYGRVVGVKGTDRVAVSVLGCGELAFRPCNLKRRAMIDVMERPTHIDDDDVIIRKACDQARNDSDPSGDGDQSTLVDDLNGPGAMLRGVWARGADLNPWLGANRYSTFFAACAWGDLLAVQALLADERSIDLELRESKLRYSPLHVCVAGSRVPYGSDVWPRRCPLKAMGVTLPELVPDHCAVAKLLIERRARVDARDILGHTPLALACGTHATQGSLEVARVLAAGGASVHAVNRFGDSMMMIVIAQQQTGNVRYDVAEALLQMGFDLDRPFPSQHKHIGTLSMRAFVKNIMMRLDRPCCERLLKLFARYSKPGTATTSAGKKKSKVTVEEPVELNQDFEAALSSFSSMSAEALANPPEPEAPKLEYGTPVRLGRLVSRAELNGARAYILGFSDGRYEIELATDGTQMRLKPENVDEDKEGGDTDAAVDPRELRSWPGLGVTHVINLTSKEPTADNAAVAWCFQQAMPAGSKMTMACEPNGEKSLSPFAQWVYSLFHIVINWESGVPQGASRQAYRCWRIMLEDEDETENLTIDILDTVRECPPYVPAVQPSLPSDYMGLPPGPHKRRQRCGAPLLAIRYLHNSRKHPDMMARMDAITATMPDRSDPVTQHASKQMGCECAIGKVHAASVAEISAALDNLRANETMLSSPYRSWFFGLSPLHGEKSGFRPSFLVPPREPAAKKPPVVCVGCDRQQADGEKFQQCERCGSRFCSKACLVASWKEHKKVCRKREEKLADSLADATRKSVIFDLRPPPELDGKYFMNVSMTGGAAGSHGFSSHREGPNPKPLDATEAPKNIHGAREFAVKVQPPGPLAVGEKNCLVYDESRSFQGWLPLATHGIEALLELIRMYGVHRPGGSKGYFMARREGTRLRIFADKLIPPPAW